MFHSGIVQALTANLIPVETARSISKYRTRRTIMDKSGLFGGAGLLGIVLMLLAPSNRAELSLAPHLQAAALPCPAAAIRAQDDITVRT
jgi:hypothetical protein